MKSSGQTVGDAGGHDVAASGQTVGDTGGHDVASSGQTVGDAGGHDVASSGQTVGDSGGHDVATIGNTVSPASFTVKPSARVPVPAEFVTETVLKPGVASTAMEMSAVIWMSLSTVKSLTTIPLPKLTPSTRTPVKLVPVMTGASDSP